MKYNLKSLQDTEKFAQIIIEKLKKENKTCVCLKGDLGSGKTTLTQFIAKRLGVKENVISPTFVLLKEYKTNDDKFKVLAHADFYRLSSKEDIKAFSIDEYIKKNVLLIVEWPEKIDFTHKNCIDIKLNLSDNKRYAELC